MTLDYLDHLRRESARFAEVLRGTSSDTRVPTCPDWDADDLFWHLADVQWFWGEVVARRVTTTEEADSLERDDRPGDRAGLAQFYAEASARLSRELTDASPETAVWTWSDAHTVGFIRRRQAHEALVHRLDAELTADARTTMDPALCADGVDEALRVMYGGHPDWSTFTPDPAQTLRFRATDTGDSWHVTLGRLTGNRPGKGPYDDVDLGVANADGGDETAATVSGTAEDLDCWLWHRPTVAEIDRSGDQSVLTAFDDYIRPGIQ